MEELRFDHGWGRLPRILPIKMARLKLGQYESQVAWAIVYYTVGYSKFDDHIAQSQLVEITGIDKRHMNRTIKSLIKKGVIVKKGNRYRLLLNINDMIKTPPEVTYHKVTWTGIEYTSRGVKKSPPEADSKDSSKDLYPKKAVSESKMTKKEIDKLERLEWMRATMIYQGEWDIIFIDKLIKDHEFMKLYDCWLELQEAYNVRDSKRWYLAKLDKWHGDR